MKQKKPAFIIINQLVNYKLSTTSGFIVLLSTGESVGSPDSISTEDLMAMSIR